MRCIEHFRWISLLSFMVVGVLRTENGMFKLETLPAKCLKVI